MSVFYNDNDPKACAWLRELIAQGHLPPGTVDERSILEIKPDEIRHYDQCHFFAGIGGWPLALRWAGLEGIAGIWTGSCPCQPLSCAGKRQGHADERHLWPAFYDLIAECRPATVFGEQVASKDGREWFAGVRLDLEGMGYACGGADLCAAGVGAPHRRQRLFWVADADGRHKGDGKLQRGREHGQRAAHGGVVRLADTGHADLRRGAGCGEDEGWRAHATSSGHRAWARCDILPCRDGKARRVEAGTFPLADGIPGRMGLLRGYGNAIVPEVAEVFVRAWIESGTHFNHGVL